MGQTNSPAFGRTLGFTRSSERNGFFSWPTTTFTLTRSEDGRELGRLSMRGKKAGYTSATDAKEDFRLRKNFWGTRWYYDGGDQLEFGYYRMGWNMKPSFVFRGGERFFLKAPFRNPFRLKRRPGEPSQSATFFREDTPVMVLQNFAPTSFFYNEVTAKLEGTIGTDIADIRVLSGLLILFQTYIAARNRHAH